MIKDVKQNWQLYLLGLPGIVVLIIFSFIPMFGHVLAFKRYTVTKGFFNSPWCGLENFKFFFGSNAWLQITWNTLFLNVLFITGTILMALVTAIFINEISNAFFKRVVQSFVFLPYFVSWLVVSLMVFALLNGTDGMVNNMLKARGWDSIPFYQTPGLWPALLTFIYIWKFSGYYSIIFLAAIIGISQDYYDSANIDGAGKWKQIWYITLPLLKPTVITLLLLCIGRIFYGDFGMIYGIIGDNGVLFPTTDVIDTYSFRALRQLGDFGMSSAVCLYQSALGFFTIMIFNRIVKKNNPEQALF
ncbi:ABC transporter permease subunit [Hungatella hathewayi]|uniref:ABC transporter permease n=1 Tax=Hungatella hathewayi TaxID=154046 RepID=UPI00210B34F3|nr:ABC transporter permease subunit [Hungatella hathewayi]MCQ5385896.1 ABC transporter permease subunit [Hungatella hathewayi]